MGHPAWVVGGWCPIGICGGDWGIRSSPGAAVCVKLSRMGSKDKGRKEVKKAPKPKPKPEPVSKREVFTPAPPK